MSERNRAIFNDGVLKPVEPIEAKNGDVFEFVRVNAAQTGQPRSDAAKILSEIAQRFKDTNLPADVSTNHDHYLYGAKKKGE